MTDNPLSGIIASEDLGADVVNGAIKPYPVNRTALSQNAIHMS
jgi:hypothetical protein